MWNKLRNNFLCDEKEVLRISQIHLEKLINIKTHIDNKRPITPLFFRNKTILKESNRKKEREINFGNNIIYTRLSSVKNILSPYSKSRNIPKYCPAFDKKKFDFAKKEKQRTISSENFSFFKRFIKRKSFYPFLNFMKKSKYDEYIKNNISKAKFLPKISLKLCTFKELKKKLMRASTIFNENSRYICKINLINKENISNDKAKKKKIHLNNIFNKEKNNNKWFDDGIKKKNSNYLFHNLKRAHIVKKRNYNKIILNYI